MTTNNETKNTQQPEATTTGPVVRIANGAGNNPVTVSWQQGDTVASVLKRANITIERGRTATIGRRRIKDPAKTEIKAGEVIVIAGKPSNG